MTSVNHNSSRQSPPKPNMPANMLRAIAAQASPRTRAVMSRATNLPRRQMPIGLAVTKARLSVIPRNRPPPVNRSRATAKPARGLKRYVMGINKFVPVAYKNQNWRFFSQLNRGQIIFFNTQNGAPFMFHKKTGERIPLKPRAAWVTDGIHHLAQITKIPRQPRNTWNEYMKRIGYVRKYIIKGQSQRNRKRAIINNAVGRYVSGNLHALNAFSVPDLAWWSKGVNWMNANGNPYVKIGGQWHRYGGRRVTKNNILTNIQLMHSMR